MGFKINVRVPTWYIFFLYKMCIYVIKCSHVALFWLLLLTNHCIVKWMFMSFFVFCGSGLQLHVWFLTCWNCAVLSRVVFYTYAFKITCYMMLKNPVQYNSKCLKNFFHCDTIRLLFIKMSFKWISQLNF